MAKIKGICRNDECDLCLEQKIQEAEKSNFVCESCGKPLVPFGNDNGGNGDKKRKIILAVIAVAVIALIVGVVLMLSKCGKGDDKVDPVVAKIDTIMLNHTTATLNVGETDTLKVANLPNGAAAEYHSPKDKALSVDKNGVVTALKEGESKVQVRIAGYDNLRAICVYTITKKIEEKPTDGGGGEVGGETGPNPNHQPLTGYGTVNLGYGTYTGDLKNGKPHGHGVITYKRQHQIVSSKDFVANPGDRYEGDFRDGQIESIGYWYHDGQTTGVKP